MCIHRHSRATTHCRAKLSHQTHTLHRAASHRRSNDTFARYLSVGLTERLGKQVVVDNRAGADGIIGTEIAARSAPDGHTWLMASGAYAMNAAVRKMPYDAAKSFDWIATLGNGTTVLTINLNFPVNSVKDILALGKAKPGYINLASAGGFQHFISELFRYQSGLNLQILLYKGGYPALLDVVSGFNNICMSKWL